MRNVLAPVLPHFGRSPIFFLGSTFNRTSIGPIGVAESPRNQGGRLWSCAGIARCRHSADGENHDSGRHRRKSRGPGILLGLSHQCLFTLALVWRSHDAGERSNFRNWQSGSSSDAYGGRSRFQKSELARWAGSAAVWGPGNVGVLSYATKQSFLVREPRLSHWIAINFPSS